MKTMASRRSGSLTPIKLDTSKITFQNFSPKLSWTSTNGEDLKSASFFPSLKDGSCSSKNKLTHRVGQHSCILMENLRKLYDSKTLCDVELIAGEDDKRVPAHRLILTACSEYFAAMFTGNMREATEKQITLKEVKGEILENLIEFCYTGSIEINEDNAEDLVVSASLLQLDDVVSACWAFLERQLDTSNCLGLAFFAERHNCTILQNLIEEYICANFSKVCKQEEFLQLNAENLGKLLASDDLNVQSEEDVFHSVMSWLHHDPLNRKAHMPVLLGLIRMALLAPAFIVEHVEPICEQNDCEKLVIKALKWQLSPKQRTIFTSQRTKPRKSTINVLLALGGTDYSTSHLIERYCPRSDKWSVWGIMPEKRISFGAAMLDYKLMVIGGLNANNLATNTVHGLDLYTMAWTVLNPMLTDRAKFGIAVLNDFVYVAGGTNKEGNMLDTAERLDPFTRQWYSIAPMRMKRVNPGMAALNGLIYIVGGRTFNNTVTSTMSCYDMTTNKWSSCAAMSTSRTSVAAVAVGGYLYVFGGSTDYNERYYSNEVERYDPKTDTWKQMKPMNAARSGVFCTLLGECVLIVGGKQHGCTVEMYDTHTDEWINMSSSTYSRSEGCVVAIPNVIPATLPPSDTSK